MVVPLQQMILQQQMMLRMQQQATLAAASLRNSTWLCRIYVGSLPMDITEKQLQDAFAACGTVRHISLNKVRAPSWA